VDDGEALPMNFYNVIKAVHIIAVVSWFAGCFYIFRLFVYHVQNRMSQDTNRVFEVMEKKLLKIIMNPALALVFVTGVGMLILSPQWLKMGWLHIKLLFFFVLVGYHFFALHIQKKFFRGEFILTEKQCRIMNEIPTLVLIISVLMVVLKPF